MGQVTSTRPVTHHDDDAVHIRQDIARTRYDMSRTLEAIEAKLSPDALKQRAKDAAYDATVGKMDTMFDTVKANPIPLALTAVGIGWFIASTRASSAPSGKVARAKQLIGDKAEVVGDKATEAASELKEQAVRVEGSIEQTFRDNPLAIGLGVLAAGLVIGLAIPITQKENEWLGSARDKLVDKTQELANKALDKAQPEHDGQQVNQGASPAPTAVGT